LAAPAWKIGLLLDLGSVQMPVLTRAEFTFGFGRVHGGTETPPVLNAFTSAQGEKDRACFLLPPAFNSLAAHSFEKWSAGIWCCLGFHSVACRQLSSRLLVQLGQAV